MIIMLPWPPSVNHYWRHVVLKTKRGLRQQTLLSMQGRHFRTDATTAIRKQFPVHSVINEPVKVEIHLFPPDRRKRDIDNYCKGILDALTHARIWTDDYLVSDLHLIRRQVVPGGQAVLRITRNAATEKTSGWPEPVRDTHQQ